VCVCVCVRVCTRQGMGSGRQTSTIVKAAARRQLRGVLFFWFFWDSSMCCSRFLRNLPVKSMFWFTSSSCDVLESAGDSDKKPVKEVAAEIRKKLKGGPDGEQCI